MRQAGRSLPEYRELRRGRTLMELATTPELAAEVTLQSVRRHGVDAAILFSDIVVPLAAIGVDVDLRGVFNTGQRVGPLMRQHGHGTIVNIAAAAAAAATKLHVSYSPAQAAIISLSRCMNACWPAPASPSTASARTSPPPAGSAERRPLSSPQNTA